MIAHVALVLAGSRRGGDPLARDLGTQGIEAYQANDFTGADAKLDRAYRLFAAPTLGLWSARARLQLGRWVEAAEGFAPIIAALKKGEAATIDGAWKSSASLDARNSTDQTTWRTSGKCRPDSSSRH